MTERYLGSIITASPTEPSEGYADSTASGVWNVHDPLIFNRASDWPDPTNASPDKFIENLFSCYTYTGNGSTQSINNGIDLNDKDGLVWIKQRQTAGYQHLLFDTERGATKYLSSDNTLAEQTDANSLTGFASNGFTLGNSSNGNRGVSGESGHVAWTFRKQPKFFDIVTYTGNGSAGRTVSHNLGSVPGMIIIKKTNNTKDWCVFHRSKGKAFYGLLNTTASFVDDAGDARWHDTDPTATEFTLGNDSEVNANSDTYVAYLFAHNDGDGGFGSTGDQDIIKCGTYDGDGSTSNSVTVGFEPQWILIKNISATWSWVIFDNIRGIVTGYDDEYLLAEASDQAAAAEFIELTADGFKLSADNLNTNNSSSTYIYMAIRRGPMKAPTAGTDVFAIDSLDGSPLPSWDSGFPVDMALMRYNVDQSDDTQIASRLLSKRQLLTSTNAAESSNSLHTFDSMTGWGSRTSTTANWYSWMFRRAPEFFDVVTYSGDGTSSRNIKHNLTVAPELIFLKNRTSSGGGAGWIAGVASLGDDEGALHSDGQFNATNLITTYSTTTFTALNADEQINKSGETYVAYLFATLAGVSKVGTYSGTGNDINVDCGFTSGARFVLVKRTDSSGDWFIWDTTNGIVAGDDPYLLLNTSGTQVTNQDYIDPLSSGFTITSGASSDLNTSGGTYLFLAIA